MFRCVSYNFGALGTAWLSYKTRCKTVVMVQKFVPRSLVGIFCNERTRSTPLDPKKCFGAFHKILVHLGPFSWLAKLDENGPKWCKSSCHEALSEFFATNAPIPPQWTLNSCFGAFRTILVHLGPFGWLTKLGAKRDELVQKFVVRSRIENFRNERTRSIPLDPKLMFWCISYNFGALGTVWLTYETRCKMGRTGAKVRATKLRLSFSQPTHPIHPIGPWTHVLVRIVQFWCNCDRLVELQNSVQNGPK